MLKRTIKDQFESTFTKEGPWSYNTEYEVQKRQHLLSLLQSDNSLRALEIGCAEGHATGGLANRVEHLTAIDVSSKALSRAAKRCKDFNNITFIEADVFSSLPHGKFDLIVCSEIVLYEVLKCIRNSGYSSGFPVPMPRHGLPRNPKRLRTLKPSMTVRLVLERINGRDPK